MSQYANHLFDQDSSNNSWANMLSFIPRGSRVLDVGCATGNFAEALEQLHECTVTGVDIDPGDIAEAKEKISEAYVLDITRGDGFAALGTFDVIVFADVLEHLVDPREALRTAKELLNDNGIIVYSIPHMGHLSVRFNVLEGRFPYTELGLLDRTHLHFYDRNEVDDIFAQAGFTITSQNPTLVGYPEQWIADKLMSMGLASSPQFLKLLQATDADVYQFIGCAIPTRDVPTVVPVVTDETGTPDELLRRATELIDLNEKLRVELHALQARLGEIRRNPLGVMARAAIRRVRRH